MTIPDPIEAAIEVGVRYVRQALGYGRDPGVIAAAIRAAAPILIAAGRAEERAAIDLQGRINQMILKVDAIRAAESGGTP